MNERIDLSKKYSETLLKLGAKYPRLIVVDSDLPDSCSTEAFGKAYPNRAWDIGIAEQNLPLVSAGLALAGLVPVYHSFAVFAVHRGVDMIRQAIAYNRANVKIVGHAAGQSMGYTGPSHHTLEDIAILRAIPGISILQPSDAAELTQMMEYMVECDGPVYLRVPRISVPDHHGANWKFEFGTPEVIAEGNDVTVFATGELVSEFLQYKSQLEEGAGYSIRLVNVGTLKPVGHEAFLRFGQDTLGAVTLEDHNVIGGLGSLVAEVYGESLYKPVQRIGIRDTFTESADGRQLRDSYGMGLRDIRYAIEKVVKAGRAIV